MRRVPLLLLALSLSGCALPWEADDAPVAPTPRPTGDGFQAPRLTFAGVVVDALDERPVEGARVVIHVNQEQPCRRPGIGWASYPMTLDAESRFGPYEVTTPAGAGWRFFVEASAVGYTTERTYVGPEQASQTRNLTLVLHPRANVTGAAPPGTVAGLETDDGFATLAVADERGRLAFEGVHVGERDLVVALDVPWRSRIAAPAEVDPTTNGSGWVLRGVARRADGAGVAADVFAWNGTTLWSAARANDVGQFALPLPPESVERLRVEARTTTGQYGGGAVLDVNGPPAATQTILMRARC